MANDLAVNTKDLVAGIRNSRQRIAAVGGDVSYLKFAKGDWIIGSADELVGPESLWAVNPLMLAHGYIAWGDGEVLGEHMVPLTAPLPPRSELDDVGGDWQECVGMQFLCVGGEFEGTQAVFKTHSKGGLQFFANLADEVADTIEKGDDHCVPVISLGSDSYQHKKYGKVFVPEYRVENWMTIDGFTTAEADSEPEQEPEPEERPRRQRRRSRAA